MIYIREYTFNKIKNVCGLSTIGINSFFTNKNNVNIVVLDTNSLNTSENKYITHNTDGELFIKDIDKPNNEDNKVKLTKVIKAITDVTDSTELEKYVSLWKKAYTIDTSIVKTSDDIAGVYNISECGGSCMAHKGSYMEIYKDFNCNIAYIVDEKGNLLARAILWIGLNELDENGNITKGNYIDRIFFEKEQYKLTLEKWAKDNNYKIMDNANKTYYTDSIGIKNYTDCGVPYIDTMCYIGVNNEDNTMFLCSNFELQASFYDCLQQTDGSSEEGEFGIYNDRVFCEDIQDYRDPDYAIYLERENCYVSDMYEDAIYIDEWGIYVDVSCDDEVVWCEDDSEYHPRDYATYCEDKEEWYIDRSILYYCESDDSWYSEDALDNIIVYSEDTEYYILIDEAYKVAETDEWYEHHENFLNRLEELNDEKL